MLFSLDQRPSSVAILSAGLSLRDYWFDSAFFAYETVIAINFAGGEFRHHLLCYTDRRTLEASRNWHTQVRRCGIRELSRWGETNGVFPGTCRYTFPCVLWEVAQLQERCGCVVDIFGWDAEGVGVSGHESPQGRWDREVKWCLAWLPKKVRVFGKADRFLR